MYRNEKERDVQKQDRERLIDREREREMERQKERERWKDRERERWIDERRTERDGQTERERERGNTNIENVLLQEIRECRKAFIYTSNWTEQICISIFGQLAKRKINYWKISLSI